MRSLRPPAWAVLTAAALVILSAATVPVGRWERDRAFARENRGIETVYERIVSLGQRTLSSYRVDPEAACLIYRQGSEPYALEICVDGKGRAVAAVDRSSDELKFWSVGFEPSAARLRVDPSAVRRAIRRLAPAETNFGPLGS